MISFVLGAGLSCNDGSVDNVEETCLRVSYIGDYYCSGKKTLHFIRFLEPTEFATKYAYVELDSTDYFAAVYNLPESVQKKDTVFYMKFHYDPKDEKYQDRYCPANSLPVKILGCEEISQKSCLTSLK